MFKLNLRSKILLSYLLLILLLGIVSTQAIKSLVQMGSDLDRIIEENFKSIFAAQSLLKTLERFQSGEWMLIAGKRKEAARILIESREEFFQLLEELRYSAKSKEKLELISKIENYYKQYLDLYQWLEKSVKAKNRPKMDFYSRAIDLQRDKLYEQILILLEMNQKSMEEISYHSRDLATQYMGSVIIISIIGMIIGIALSIWLIYNLIRPVESLTTAVSEIRKGNLDISVNAGYPDEIGILALELNKMTTRLREYQKLNLDKLLEEKKRAEAILRSVGDCMIVIDPFYQIIMVNPTAERIFYLIPGISFGRSFRDVIKSETLFNIIKASIENPNYEAGKDLPIFEWEFDRVKRHYQVRVFPVEKEDGEKIAFIVLLEDVTKFKEIDQLKSDFISIASHELRTPLTSIIMSLGMLLSNSPGPLNNDQKELLEAANEDAQHMRELLTNLLDISQIEAGRMEMEFLPVSPEKILAEVSSSFITQAQNQKIELVTDVLSDLPKVLADCNRIAQVLDNLLANAFRYTPEGGKITLSAIRINDFVQFTVADTGHGIPKEYLRKIFGKFVQVENDPKRGRAGLGLAISQEIIRAHHGSIWVNSEPGNGAHFHFTLPIARETSKEQEEKDSLIAPII